MSVFIFDAKHVFLGEMSFNAEGCFLQALLSAEGEYRLGPILAEWQTQGVPARQDIKIKNSRALIETRVQLRNARSEAAVIAWLVCERFVPLHVPSHVLGWWEKVAGLELSPEERYILLRGLCRIPLSESSTWNGIMEAAALTARSV